MGHEHRHGHGHGRLREGQQRAEQSSAMYMSHEAATPCGSDDAGACAAGHVSPVSQRLVSGFQRRRARGGVSWAARLARDGDEDAGVRRAELRTIRNEAPRCGRAGASRDYFGRPAQACMPACLHAVPCGRAACMRGWASMALCIYCCRVEGLQGPRWAGAREKGKTKKTAQACLAGRRQCQRLNLNLKL